MSGARPRTVGEAESINIPQRSLPAGSSEGATFQVRFPGDAQVYDFKTWEEVNMAFDGRGFDPRHANIHTNRPSSARPKIMGLFPTPHSFYFSVSLAEHFDVSCCQNMRGSWNSRRHIRMPIDLDLSTWSFA